MTDESKKEKINPTETAEKIWPPAVAFYVEAMLFSTNAALTSVDDVHRVISAIDSGEAEWESVDTHVFLDLLQNILTHAGMLSRYLWPSHKATGKVKHYARAEQLRRALGVDENSALKSRTLRNYIEHFDEKLDVYLANGITGRILTAYVGPSLESDGVPTHIFRAYYADKGVFKALGEEHEIQPIVDEIHRIHEILVEASKTGRLQEAPA